MKQKVLTKVVIIGDQRYILSTYIKRWKDLIAEIVLYVVNTKGTSIKASTRNTVKQSDQISSSKNSTLMVSRFVYRYCVWLIEVLGYCWSGTISLARGTLLSRSLVLRDSVRCYQFESNTVNKCSLSKC
jgi:hypothetical protein